jgi:hypothetical protein
MRGSLVQELTDNIEMSLYLEGNCGQLLLWLKQLIALCAYVGVREPPTMYQDVLLLILEYPTRNITMMVKVCFICILDVS